MEGKVTIIDGNNEIELTTIEKDIRAYMIKGEPGTDGVSPTATVTKVDDTTTLEVTDKNGTTSSDIVDGFSPTVTAERNENVTTLTFTDIDGTRTANIYDGVDLTGGVPTDGVIGWDNKDISYTCDGTEEGNYYLTYNSVDYYFTMPTVEAGDTLLFNTVDLTLKLNNTTISTASSGTGTELTFVEYIPNGYEITEESFGGGDVIVILKTITTAPSTFVKDDKYYNSTDDLIYTATSSSSWDEGTAARTTTLYLNEADNELYRYYNNSMNLLESGGGDTIPLGATFLFPGTTAPNNYMICDGSAISRTDYADLFAILGTSQGAGDGSTTFNLPNMKGRVPVGLDSTQTEFDTIGETGGSKNAVVVEHTHSNTSNALSWVGGSGLGNTNWLSAGGNQVTYSAISNPNDGVKAGWMGNTNAIINSAGESGTGKNLQPYIVINYIIKVTKTTPTQAEVVNAYSTSQEDTYSCDYINGIVESGSNANGNYTKFADGTMICRHYFGPVTTNAGSGTDTTVTLPATFLNNEYVINANILDGQAYWADIAYSVGTKTTTNFKLTTWNTGGHANTGQWFNYIAIGRWK